MMMEITKEHIESAALAAAKWWSDRLRDAAGVGDNGAHDAVSVTCTVVMMQIRSFRPPTEESCKMFERLLADRVASLIASDSERCYRDRAGFADGGPDVALRVDYNPCWLLRECLLAAGVDRTVLDVAALPLKTTMRVSARRVVVSHGYGSPWREIYGPVWGCSRAEQEASDNYRWRAMEPAWQWWNKLKLEESIELARRFLECDWQGPVPPLPLHTDSTKEDQQP